MAHTHQTQYFIFLKTEILNSFRQVIKLKPVENFLVTLSKNKNLLARKVIGTNTLFARGSMRTCNRHGINYILDISDYMDHGIYFGFDDLPDFDRRKLYSITQSDDVIFDVGANIGDTVLHFAKMLNNTGKVYGFEPVPALFERLKKNVALNNFTNIVINNIALSDKKADLFFNLPAAQNSGGIFLSNTATDNTKKVLAVSMDDFCFENKIEKLNVIKIDVEGFELKVLQGATETLKKFKPKMFIEVNDFHLHRAGGSAKELVQLLQSFNYTITEAETNETINPDFDFAGKHFDIVCA